MPTFITLLEKFLINSWNNSETGISISSLLWLAFQKVDEVYHEHQASILPQNFVEAIFDEIKFLERHESPRYLNNTARGPSIQMTFEIFLSEQKLTAKSTRE